MDGRYRELIATDRQPLLSADEVNDTWGAYGSLVGKVILPGRDNLALQSDDPVFVADQTRRTLMIFDARESKRSAPHYIIVSLTSLAKAAGRRGSGRPRDIQHLHQGESLHVGMAPHNWLPEELSQQERAIQRRSKGEHHNRKVISDEQTVFYVGEDLELHVLCKGNNADMFVGYPNSTERQYQADESAYEANLRRQLADERSKRAADLAGALTTNLASRVTSTEYLPQHARGASHTHTVPVADRMRF
jgi:hypothetical protein